MSGGYMLVRFFFVAFVISNFFHRVDAQVSQRLTQRADSVMLYQKLALLKQASRRLPKAEQKKFQDVYLDFLKEYKQNFRCSYLTLTNLAKASTFIHNTDAFDCLNSLISFRSKEIELREYYFAKISKEVGLRAALDFLQIEALVTYFNSNRHSEASATISNQMNGSIRDIAVQFETDQQKVLDQLQNTYAKTLSNRAFPGRWKAKREAAKFISIEREYIQLQEKYLSAVKNAIDSHAPAEPETVGHVPDQGRKGR